MLSASVQVSESGEWEEWPHDELLDHDLASDHSEDACGSGVEGWSDVAVVDVFSADDVCPVPLGWRLVLVRLPVEDSLLDEVHSHDHGKLVLLRNAAIVLIEMVEVVLVARIELLTQKNRHIKI